MSEGAWPEIWKVHYLVPGYVIACAQTVTEKFAKSMTFLEMTLLVIVSESLFGEITLLLIVQGRSLSVVALLIGNPA